MTATAWATDGGTPSCKQWVERVSCWKPISGVIAFARRRACEAVERTLLYLSYFGRCPPVSMEPTANNLQVSTGDYCRVTRHGFPRKKMRLRSFCARVVEHEPNSFVYVVFRPCQKRAHLACTWNGVLG